MLLIQQPLPGRYTFKLTPLINSVLDQSPIDRFLVFKVKKMVNAYLFVLIMKDGKIYRNFIH